jgi:DNA-binding NarL/FixJ family response regulator
MSTKILIADCFETIQEGIKSLVKVIPDVTVIGQTNNGRIAVQMAHELKPDVIITDIEIYGLNGIDATCQIVQCLPNIKIIAFSAHLKNHYVYEMFKAGALGYVSKYSNSQELVTAIKTVISGRTYLSPKITSVVIDGYLNQSTESISPYSLLSTKEREVFQLIAEGKTTKNIALELNVSTKTVEWRRNKVMQKLNLQNIVELVKYAILEGLTSTYT